MGMPALLANQSQQMQRIKMTRLNFKDFPIQRLRLGELPLPMPGNRLPQLQGDGRERLLVLPQHGASFPDICDIR